MSNNIVEISQENFATIIENSEAPVLVDFWAPWCGPCKALNPVIEQVAENVAGQATVAKINVDDERELAQKFGVRGIPVILLFQNGKVIQNVSDLRTTAGLTEIIKSHLSGTSIEETMLKNLDDPEMLSMFLMEGDLALVEKTLQEQPQLATTPIGEHATLPISYAIMSQKMDRVALFRKFGAKPTLNEMLMAGFIDELKETIKGLSHQQILALSEIQEAEFYANVLMANNNELTDLLIPADADLNQPGQGDQYPILQTALRMPLELLQQLVARGLNLNQRARGKTAIQLAVGNLEKVKYLIAQGVDPKVTDFEGRTALDFANEASKINPACQPVADFLASL
jgi:thioredoxin 1